MQPGTAVDGPARCGPALATVCISGTLEDKLTAAAAAGFDGVEIFEPDFVASPLVGGRGARTGAPTWACRSTSTSRSGTSTAAGPEMLQANLRRAERKFDVMEQLGTDLILVCSSVSPDAVDDDDRIAEQLHQLAVPSARAGPAGVLRGAGLGHAT